MNQSLKTTLDTGARMVRPRPPYWNNCGKVACCEVGEPVLDRSAKYPIDKAIPNCIKSGNNKT